MTNIILATGNQGKVSEFQTFFATKTDTQLIAQSEYQVSEIEETGLTFIENAILKARHACQQTNLPTIADDSGLVVDALNGKPGIFSARFSGPDASSKKNNEKLLHLLADTPTEARTARFVCVLVYLKSTDDPLPMIVQGIWEGNILTEPSGNKGFGYDPIFWVPTHQCSAAELNTDIKNQLSHRGQAMKKLLSQLNPDHALGAEKVV